MSTDELAVADADRPGDLVGGADEQPVVGLLRRLPAVGERRDGDRRAARRASTSATESASRRVSEARSRARSRRGARLGAASSTRSCSIADAPRPPREREHSAGAGRTGRSAARRGGLSGWCQLRCGDVIVNVQQRRRAGRVGKPRADGGNDMKTTRLRGSGLRRRCRHGRRTIRSWRRRPRAAAGTRPRAPCRRCCRTRASPATSQVTNVPGAGGTIGLAQFVNQAKGDPEELIVGGYVMVGAILTNNSPVDLTMVTPIARLTGESEAIVVPAGSDIETMDDLVAALKADPGAVSLGRRLGGRRRPHHRRADRQGGRRRSDPGQLHRLLRRRRGARGDPRRPGHGRRLGLRRVREPDRGGPAAAARGLRREPARGGRRADAEGGRRRRDAGELAHGRGRARPQRRGEGGGHGRHREARDVGGLEAGARHPRLGRPLPRRATRSRRSSRPTSRRPRRS